MKKLLCILSTILILALALMAGGKVQSAQVTQDLTGTWDIILFYNDGTMDREIWELTQQGNTVTGYSRFAEDPQDFVRCQMTGILKDSFLTMSMKPSLDYIVEFKARIGQSGLTMGSSSGILGGGTFDETLSDIDAGRVTLSNRQDRWNNLDGQWLGRKRLK